MAEWSKALAC